ncbi:hypothetical protein [Ornithinimicrobium sp. CNJ-824]|uniref:hypothetical protein n=1 Tax=Ornithinimicrobium sp. CNJ-824 TaxID=1904966 RepID=UPI00117D9F67|nr:hypothetical protein [Ornithinimicrobium sp. CNJ-824]
MRLDLELVAPGGERGVAVELKYMTRLWAGAARGEAFTLKNHGASDLRGYDVIKDIHRVEGFVSARPGWAGLVIALTHDAGYWRAPTHGRATNANAFRLYEGSLLNGSRSWGPYTGGTSRGREAALELRGSYPLTWADYSSLGSGPAETFRTLVVEIGELDEHDH